MSNYRRFITPLRLMLVDDEFELGSLLKSELEEAAKRVGLACEILCCSTAAEALELLLLLGKEGKRVHAVGMDYLLSLHDMGPVEFLRIYLSQNPSGYWFWCSAHPGDAYEFLVGSQKDNELLHPRMLTPNNKTGGFTPALNELLSSLQDDLTKYTESETRDLILTSRETLLVSDGFVRRKDGEKEKKLNILDELVPGCPLFDTAVIIHVPSMPADATCFVDAILPKRSEGRVPLSEQTRLKSAWVSRKYFDSVYVMTANKFSKDFDPNNWQKYATQFNLNLTWLDAASDTDWTGSILLACGKGGTMLNGQIGAVAQAAQKGAVWSKIGPRNFNSQFRPWAAAYRSLKATAFFQGIEVNSGNLKECHESLPLEAAAGLISMRVHPDSHLYIDRGDHLYDVRSGVNVPLKWGDAPPQDTGGSSLTPSPSTGDRSKAQESARRSKTASKKSSAPVKKGRR